MLLLYRVTVLGHSMEPTISNGSNVLVSSVPYLFTQPKLGDIVLFTSNLHGKKFLKRITSIENNTYFLRGDNTNDSLDSRKFGSVEKKDILGKVIFVSS